MSNEELVAALINESPVKIKNWRTGELSFKKITAVIYKKASQPTPEHQIDVSVQVVDDTNCVFEVSQKDVRLEEKR